MGQATLAVEVVSALILVPAGYAWLGARARRRGIGGSVMAPFEEIWDPGVHSTHLEIQVQAGRAAPAPAPGDPPDLTDGHRRSPAPEGHAAASNGSGMRISVPSAR